ncbi:MAG: hypothetical protein MUF36_03065 [Bacteroidales bacterium]|nr:hypothetical protein [Bacteroidales bacterium]
MKKQKPRYYGYYGEESHSGSHSLSYGQWKFSGGGSMRKGAEVSITLI